MSIDPGYSSKNGTGVALWHEGRLQEAFLLSADEGRKFEGRLEALYQAAMSLPTPDEVVVERPKIYNFSRQKVDPEDIVKLAMLTGRLTALCSKVSLVEAPSWKGQMPKEAVKLLVGARLSEEEKAAMEKSLEKVNASVQHNV